MTIHLAKDYVDVTQNSFRYKHSKTEFTTSAQSTQGFMIYILLWLKVSNKNKTNMTAKEYSVLNYEGISNMIISHGTVD